MCMYVYIFIHTYIHTWYRILFFWLYIDMFLYIVEWFLFILTHTSIENLETFYISQNEIYVYIYTDIHNHTYTIIHTCFLNLHDFVLHRHILFNETKIHIHLWIYNPLLPKILLYLVLRTTPRIYILILAFNCDKSTAALVTNMVMQLTYRSACNYDA